MSVAELLPVDRIVIQVSAGDNAGEHLLTEEDQKRPKNES
jgi:hypothetical protein